MCDMLVAEIQPGPHKIQSVESLHNDFAIKLDVGNNALHAAVSEGKKWDYGTQTTYPGRKWGDASDAILNTLRRPLTATERQNGMKLMKCDSSNTKTIAKGKPRAVLIIGAGGAGKSTLCKKLANWFPGFDIESFCIFDGDLLRACHQNYLDVVKNDQIGYFNAWPALKPNIARAKAEILHRTIIPEKRNVIISSGIHSQKYFTLLLKSGYDIDVVGLHVTWTETLVRGINRSQWTGRTYLGTKEMWDISQHDMKDLAKRPETQRSFIMDNTNFSDPKLLYENIEGSKSE